MQDSSTECGSSRQVAYKFSISEYPTVEGARLSRRHRVREAPWTRPGSQVVAVDEERCAAGVRSFHRVDQIPRAAAGEIRPVPRMVVVDGADPIPVGIQQIVP